MSRTSGSLFGTGSGVRPVERCRGGGGEDGPRRIADTRNNALLILAKAQEYRMIESTLRRLDLVPLQVLIEATIAEVRLNDSLRYGLRWFFQADEGSTTQSVTFSDISNGAVSSTFPGFSYLFESGDVRAALNALDEITNVNVVSSPQLMVLDNETARLQVGDQVPVPTQQAQSITDPDAPIVNSIQFQDTGVILEVTPHVNASGLVVLDVRQEVSDVVTTTTSDIDAPTIQQRQIDSSVAVQTGETIALGGLIRDSEEDSRAGVPILMEVPILGNLFSSNSVASERTELLVLLTPRVVRDQEEAQEVTRELRRRLRGIKNLQERIGNYGRGESGRNTNGADADAADAKAGSGEN
jgi:general secretion pathway protein D